MSEAMAEQMRIQALLQMQRQQQEASKREAATAQTKEEPTPTEIAKNHKATLASELNKTFYKAIGYPQYAGKYETFSVPSGYKIKEITESLAGLQVAFEPIPEAPSFAERIYGLIPVTGNIGDIIMGRWLGVKVKPEPVLAVPAGVVGGVESFVYSVGRLAGLETPRIPPTLIGGVVSSALILGESPEMKEVRELGGSYAAGTVVADYLLSRGISRGISAVSPLITKGVEKIATVAERELTPEAYYYYKYILEKPMLRTITKEFVKEYAIGTAKAILGEEAYFYTAKIAIPRLTDVILPSITAAARARIMESPFGEAYLYGKGVAYPTFRYVTLPKTIDAARAILSQGRETLIGTPFGEAYLYGKAVAYPTIKHIVISEYAEIFAAARSAFLTSPLGETWLFGKGVAYPTIRYTAEKVTRQASLTASELLRDTKAETTLSRMILGQPQKVTTTLILIPKTAAIKALPKMAPQIIGYGGVLATTLIPRAVQKPQKKERVLPILGLQPISAQEPLLKVTSLSKTILGSTQIQEQVTLQEQVQEQVQEQIQIQRQTQRQAQKQLQMHLQITRQISVSSAILGKKKGAWFYKRHPVATGREVASHILGGLPKGRGSKGKLSVSSAILGSQKRRKK